MHISANQCILLCTSDGLLPLTANQVYMVSISFLSFCISSVLLSQLNLRWEKKRLGFCIVNIIEWQQYLKFVITSSRKSFSMRPQLSTYFPLKTGPVQICYIQFIIKEEIVGFNQCFHFVSRFPSHVFLGSLKIVLL